MRPSVLVSEDDATSRLIIKRAIDSIDYNPILCSDGQRAWETLLDNPDVKLVITDVQMPRLDGFGFIKLMRENERLRDIPIIIVSGVVTLSEITTTLEEGASRFLPKPINMQELQYYMKRLVEGLTDEVSEMSLQLYR